MTHIQAAVRLEDKDPFPDLSNAIKNTYHSRVNASDAEGADDLVYDTVYALYTEFEHLLIYACHRIDQEFGGKSFKVESLDQIADTKAHQPRDDFNGVEFYSAEAVFPNKVTSRIKFALDLKSLIKAALPTIVEHTEMPLESLHLVLYSPKVMEQMPILLKYVANKVCKGKREGTKLLESAEDFIHSKATVKQTSAGENPEIQGTLSLKLVEEQRLVDFVLSPDDPHYIISTSFTFAGKIQWP